MAYSVDKLSTIDLGRQGENLARTVEIDVSSLLAQWPDAIISLLCKRKHDTVPYVAVTEVKDGMLIWPITSVETEAAGDGKIELRAVCGEIIAKSMTAVIRVTTSLTGSETQAPDAAQGWVDQVLAAGSGVEANAIRAEDAADQAEGYAVRAEEAVSRAEEVVATVNDSVDLTQEASRQAGQEAAAAEASAEQARQIAEDVSAEAERIETAVADAELAADKIDGMKVAAETLEPGVPATVTIADDGTVKTISFGIPKGNPGEKPVRGEDYWTETDKEEVVSEAVAETLEQVQTISFYFCTESEVDENSQPVINAPDDHTFYLVPSGEEEPNLFIEWVYLNEKWERFGSATIDLSGYVKNTDYASSTKHGIVRVLSGDNGVIVDGNGLLKIYPASENEVAERTQCNRPVLPKHLDIGVKKALADSKLTDTVNAWTEDEKAAARELLGAVGTEEYASTTVAGVVKVGSGLRMSSQNALTINPATTASVENRAASGFALTLNHIDLAVKVGVTSNTLELTDEEKKAARTWLGAVGNEEYATATTPGIAKVGSGLRMSSGGAMTLAAATDDQIADKKVVAPITPTNLDRAVKTSLTTNTLELTDEEQAAAQEWLGTGKIIDDSKVVPDHTWSSHHLLENLTMPFEVSGPIVQCYPVENSPLSVQAEINPVQHFDWMSKAGSTTQITTTGKNLYPGTDIEFTGYSTLIKDLTLVAGETYTLSADVESSDTDDSTCLLSIWGVSVSISRGARTSVSFTVQNAEGGMRFYASTSADNSSGDTATFRNIQIEVGSTATEYEPYTGGKPSPSLEYPQLLTDSILPGSYYVPCSAPTGGYWRIEIEEALGSVTGKQDVIEVDSYTGRYRIERTKKSYTITGDEEWNIYSNKGFLCANLSTALSTVGQIGTHFGYAPITASTVEPSGFFADYRNSTLYLRVEGITTVDGLKAFFKSEAEKGTPVTLLWPITPIAITGQATHVTAKSNLKALGAVTMGLTAPDIAHPCEISVAAEARINTTNGNLFPVSSYSSASYGNNLSTCAYYGDLVAVLQALPSAVQLRISGSVSYTEATDTTVSLQMMVIYANGETVTVREYNQSGAFIPGMPISSIYFYHGNSSVSGERTTTDIMLWFSNGMPETYVPPENNISEIPLIDDFNGGTVDITSGVATEMWDHVVLDGTESWVSHSNGRYHILLPSLPDKNAKTPAICNAIGYLISSTGAGFYLSTQFLCFGSDFVTTFATDLDEWKAYLAEKYASGNPIVVYYKLAQPNLTSFEPQPVTAIDGTNTIYSDAESITVSGRESPLHTIQSLTERIAALETAATTT